jgi:hypothetical protein
VTRSENFCSLYMAKWAMARVSSSCIPTFFSPLSPPSLIPFVVEKIHLPLTSFEGFLLWDGQHSAMFGHPQGLVGGGRSHPHGPRGWPATPWGQKKKKKKNWVWPKGWPNHPLGPQGVASHPLGPRSHPQLVQSHPPG